MEDALSSGLILDALFNLCLLTNAVTEVIELSSANFTLADSCNRDDGRRMNGENLFAANTVGNTTDSNGLIDAAMLSCNDSAFECLSTLTAAFFNLYENTDGVANVHLGEFGLHVALIKSFDKIHFRIPF